MSSQKSRRAKARVNYDPAPPRCGDCKHFHGAQKASRAVVVRDKVVAPALRWVPAHCRIHKFAVEPGGICDNWVDRATGDILEP